MSKPTTKKEESSLDLKAQKEFKAAIDRIGAIWPEGTQDILSKRNPTLLVELSRLENVLGSLIAIPNKPTVLKKKFKQTLEEYEKVASSCVTYARRHIDLGNS